MAWSIPPAVRLSKHQRRELTKLAARTSAPHALVQRARMILRLASGQWPATVARALGVSDRCVRKWRGRWLAPRGARGRGGGGRPGRPPRRSGAGKGEVGGVGGGAPEGAPFPRVWSA